MVGMRCEIHLIRAVRKALIQSRMTLENERMGADAMDLVAGRGGGATGSHTAIRYCV